MVSPFSITEKMADDSKIDRLKNISSCLIALEYFSSIINDSPTKTFLIQKIYELKTIDFATTAESDHEKNIIESNFVWLQNEVRGIIEEKYKPIINKADIIETDLKFIFDTAEKLIENANPNINKITVADNWAGIKAFLNLLREYDYAKTNFGLDDFRIEAYARLKIIREKSVKGLRVGFKLLNILVTKEKVGLDQHTIDTFHENIKEYLKKLNGLDVVNPMKGRKIMEYEDNYVNSLRHRTPECIQGLMSRQISSLQKFIFSVQYKNGSCEMDIEKLSKMANNLCTDLNNKKEECSKIQSVCFDEIIDFFVMIDEYKKYVINTNKETDYIGRICGVKKFITDRNRNLAQAKIYNRRLHRENSPPIAFMQDPFIFSCPGWQQGEIDKIIDASYFDEITLQCLRDFDPSKP